MYECISRIRHTSFSIENLMFDLRSYEIICVIGGTVSCYLSAMKKHLKLFVYLLSDEIKISILIKNQLFAFS